MKIKENFNGTYIANEIDCDTYLKQLLLENYLEKMKKVKNRHNWRTKMYKIFMEIVYNI